MNFRLVFDNAVVCLRPLRGISSETAQCNVKSCKKSFRWNKGISAMATPPEKFSQHSRPEKYETRGFSGAHQMSISVETAKKIIWKRSWCIAFLPNVDVISNAVLLNAEKFADFWAILQQILRIEKQRSFFLENDDHGVNFFFYCSIQIILPQP